MSFVGTQGTVLCCLCGVPTQPNPSNMCVSCIATQIDVTEDIQKELTLLYCQKCESYFQPPRKWIKAELESRELLAFCLKRIKGLSKVKLVDAEFVWTDPHLKRIKVKVTVQKEFHGAIVQGSCVVLYVVQKNMCLDCNRKNSNIDTWTACVQVRQHVSHKRTFLYLEQLVLKHKAHENTVNIKALHEGVDFYFGARPLAQKFVDFLQAVVPVKSRHDRSLVSQDTKSNTYNYKYTFSVEIVPICKVGLVHFGDECVIQLQAPSLMDVDDLVCLPPKVSQQHGGIGPLVVCTRVTNSLQFTDPLTTKSFYMDAPTYWRHGFKSIRSSRQSVTYVVLDIEPVSSSNDRFCLAEATVARESDFGTSDQIYSINTHLGHNLKPGDTALGYDLINAILVNDDLEAAVDHGYSPPDVILIKKSYDKARKKRQRHGGGRNWTVDQLNMEVDPTHRKDDKEDQERELFLQEIEEDKDLQAQIPLYADPHGATASDANAMQTSDSDGEEDDLEVAVEHLITDL